MIDKLKAYHAAWCQLTGQDPTILRFELTERLWWEIAHAGITEDDLRCVLRFLLHQNTKHDPKYRLRINAYNLLSDVERFACWLGEAKAWDRNRKPAKTDKERVLEMSGRKVETPVRVHHISEFLKQPSP